MLKFLNLTASETLALQNAAPERHHPRLPVKTAHLFSTPLRSGERYELSGWKVLAVHGHNWTSFSGVTVPFEHEQRMTVTEPVLAGSRESVAELLRQHWEAGEEHERIPAPLLRKSRAEHAPLTVYLGRTTLRQVQDLHPEEILTLGLREARGGFTFRDTATGFTTPVLALADHWNAHHKQSWAENPWCWHVDLGEPVVHLSEAETYRQAQELAAQLHREDAQLNALEAAVSAQRAARHALAQRLTRTLHTHSRADEMHIAGYRVHFASGQAKPVRDQQG